MTPKKKPERRIEKSKLKEAKLVRGKKKAANLYVSETKFDDVKVEFRTKPLPYQKECFQFLEKYQGRALIADEMGLGKSFESMYWAVKKKKFPILVICPASVKSNWQREAQKHFGLRAEILEGTRPKKSWRPVRPIVIVNYDILKSWKILLKKMKPKTVILDECHYCKSRTAVRTRTAQSICSIAENVLALSGTPIENNPVEFYPILNMIRPGMFEGGFKGYAHRYCKPERKPWGWVFTGASRMPELNRILLKNCMIRRLKKDVLKDLPAKSRNTLVIDGDPKIMREYKKAEKDFIQWLEENAGSAKARRASRAVQITKTAYLRTLAAEAKVAGVLEWADQFLQSGEKIVLFGVHRKILQRFQEHYKDRCVIVNGSVTGKKRQEAVDKFQQNSKCQVFLGNIKAAGVGIDLTAASNLGFIELGWTPGGVTQAEDRIHRIRQEKPCFINYFLTHDTIEEKICSLLQRKQKMIVEALDGRGQGDRFNVFDEFIKGLLPNKKRLI